MPRKGSDHFQVAAGIPADPICLSSTHEPGHRAPITLWQRLAGIWMPARSVIVERWPARPLSRALRRSGRDDRVGTDWDRYGHTGDSGKIGNIPCCLSNAYTIGLGHTEYISPPSLLWCPVSSVPGPGVHSPIRKVVITPKGADDDVADPSTGTDKGNPTVTAISAIPADSESENSARNSHPCGCRHSC